MQLIPDLEKELAPPVVAHFQAAGYATQVEVYFNGRIADVIAARSRPENDGEQEVIAIELKLRDWETAHRQAIAYQVGCHRTYVGMPLIVCEALRKQTRVEKAFRESGVGLLAINHPHGDVRVVWEARKSDRILDFLASHLVRAQGATSTTTGTQELLP